MADESRAPRDARPLLRFTLRTPHAAVIDALVLGVRLPTSSGLVGVRPRGEPIVVVVEPGLIVMRESSGERFAATAGGLLSSDRERCEILTPFAVAGSEDEVLAALDAALTAPDSEIAARRKLGELEARILEELRADAPRPHAVSGGRRGDG